MDSFYSDERISAYLDGELSADEQVRFEERLAENAELRQLVEELRALRGSLDLLPRYQLEPDFAERVLRRAEQQMLVSVDGGSGDGGADGGALGGAAETHAASPTAASGGPESAQPSSHLALDESRRFRRRIVRPLIYAGAAVAAAILITVFTPPAGNDVPNNRLGERPARRGDDEIASASRTHTEKELQDLGVQQSKTPVQENRTGAQAVSQPGRPAKDSKPAADEGKRGLRDSELAKSAEREGMQKEARSSSPSHSSLAGIPAGGASASGNRLPSDAGDRAELTDSLRRNGYGAALGNAALANVVVAKCIATPAAADQAFLGLLEKNGIAMRQSAGTSALAHDWADAAQIPLSTAWQVEDSLTERDRSAPADKSADKSAGADGRRLHARLPAVDATAKETPGDIEVVYVEGSQEQVEGLLSDIQADSMEFHSLKIGPAAQPVLSLLRQATGAPPAAAAMGGIQQQDAFAATNKPRGEELDDLTMSKRESGGIAAGGGSYGEGFFYRAVDPATKGAAVQNGTQPPPSAGAGTVARPDAGKPPTPFYAKPADDSSGGFQKNDSNGVKKPVAGEAPRDIPLQIRSLAEPPAVDKKPAGLPNDSAPENAPAPTALGTTGPESRGASPAGPPAAATAPQEKASAANEAPLGDKAEGSLKQIRRRETDLGAKRADEAKQDQSEPLSYAVRIYRSPADAKQQIDGTKLDEQKLEDAPAGGATAGRAAHEPKSTAPAAPAPPAESAPSAGLTISSGITVSGGAAGRPGTAAPAKPVAPTASTPSPVQELPAFRVLNRPADPSAAKSAKEPAPAKPDTDKPVSTNAVGKKPAGGQGLSAETESQTKLRFATKDDAAAPAAIPVSPQTAPPGDYKRSELGLETPRNANADGASPVSPRMHAIFIFRIAPPPTAEASPATAPPSPAAGPPAAEKAKQ